MSSPESQRTDTNASPPSPTVSLKRARATEDDAASPGEKTPQTNPDERYCNYYVTRKHRFCKTERKPGTEFCPTHLNTAAECSDDAQDVRVPCPINPNHTVFASRLEKHVTVCPDLRFVTSKLPYFVEDKHGGRGEGTYTAAAVASAEALPPRFTHRDLSPESLAALTAKIESYYRGYVEPQLLHLDDLGHSADADRLLSSTEARSQKHNPQHAALLRCLLFTWRQHVTCTNEAAGSVGTTATATTAPRISGFLELGAGKGGLSVALQQVLTSEEEAPLTVAGKIASSDDSLCACTVAAPRLVVVDFDSFRRKGDARVSHSRVRLERWRINIKDLNLTQAFRTSATATAAAGTAGPEQWVALGKHLCGACTDFALSCLTEDRLTDDAGVAVEAVVLATCCHHRCELRHMNPVSACTVAAESGREAGSTGDDNTDSSRSTRPPRPPAVRLPGSDHLFLTEQEFAALTSMSSWTVSGSAVDTARREVGFFCKRIIDMMRVAYLREHGFTAHLCVYTTVDVTEENVCLVAWKPRA